MRNRTRLDHELPVHREQNDRQKHQKRDHVRFSRRDRFTPKSKYRIVSTY
jgi:hypothetical protein